MLSSLRTIILNWRGVSQLLLRNCLRISNSLTLSRLSSFIQYLFNTTLFPIAMHVGKKVTFLVLKMMKGKVIKLMKLPPHFKSVDLMGYTLVF